MAEAATEPETTPETEPRPACRPPAPPAPAPSSGDHRWLALAERLVAACRSGLAAIAARRGMALTLLGAAVFTLAWVSERDSAWGFPMLVGGLAMIGLGLIGPRLSGSMALRWGDDGAHFELTSTVAPPGQRHRAPELPAGPSPATATEAAAPEPGTDLVPPTEIEGQAETIEFTAHKGAL